MKTTLLKWMPALAAGLLLAGSQTACEQKASDSGVKTKTAGEALDDATLTTKVKAALLADKPSSGLAVTVNTHLKEVQLSGFVDTEEQKKRAEEIAAKVEGVKSVKNDIVVKKS